MLRGVEHKRPRSGGESGLQPGGLGAVVPVPLVAPRQGRRTGGRVFRWLAAGCLLGAFVWGSVLPMRDDPTATAECTALVLDRDTGRTYAGPCVGSAPRLPSALTALLPGALAEDVAAAR